MFCRSCGSELHENATICLKCGVPSDKGADYCPYCGKPTSPEAIMCVSCGTALVKQEAQEQKSEKSAIAAGLLALFFGAFGVHDFYLGHKARGIIKMLLSFLWLIVLVIVIPVIALCELNVEGNLALQVTLWCSFAVSMLSVIAVAIWSFVDAIMLLCGAKNKDANGHKLEY